MPEFSFVLLYVDNPLSSAAFYTALLNRPTVEESPTFAMLPLRAGVMLGLWSRKTVEPGATSPAGAGEVAFKVADASAVGAIHADWVGRGIPIAQSPTEMDFGYTFVGLDPDGHRLRVYAPSAQK
ncbi:VOC family protein [Fimbriiglobus ruber]|uniref:VOC domain-containing protein n=1 Tax=Fimbriiglobus ruber TaxID=1908690 RepID=A0A225DQP3_9BACT|nr:VOC family protein [Fimbriiglobus ruber]OWK38685.1 hypothetical protein FRUB_07805 [Fimbriiglobus ruber]